LQSCTSYLEEGLTPLSHHVFVKPLEVTGPVFTIAKSEPFVITTKGPDRKGLVAAVTEIIARYGVNVTNLQAVFKGGDDPNSNIMIYEVDIPADIDQQGLYTDLRAQGNGIESSDQYSTPQHFRSHQSHLTVYGCQGS
jgi:glycine cleavage system transcriptional repressor